MKHTPGTWKVSKYKQPVKVCNQGIDCLEIFSEGSMLWIAQVMDHREHSAADARLITAAPDLYKELKHLVRMLEPLEQEGGLNVPGLATLNGARAALKKVEEVNPAQ